MSVVFLLCAGCHLKCHKEHADKGDSAMQPCVGGKGPIRYTQKNPYLLGRTLDQFCKSLMCSFEMRASWTSGVCVFLERARKGVRNSAVLPRTYDSTSIVSSSPFAQVSVT